jgi:Holliday junction DNA helicase RuvB
MAIQGKGSQSGSQENKNFNYLKERQIRDEDETRLRPSTLDEFIGQGKALENLRIFIKAASQRKECLDHVLLSGPPGLGKTTLAYIIAKEMGSEMKSTSAPAIEKGGDLAAILTSLNSGDVLFIDEIHRLQTQIEEILYPAMEDGKIDIIIGQGPTAKSIKISLKPFTMVGATTRPGLLSSPLTARFGISMRMSYYSDEEMYRIVERTSGILKISIDKDAVQEIARRGRSTPRLVNRLLKRVRDFAQVNGEKTISEERTRYALKQMDIDEMGLDQMDRKILKTIVHFYQGGPVGLKTLATAVSEDIDTIEDIYEPFLIQSGLLKRTARGRMVTDLAYRHLKIEHETDSVNGQLPGIF